MVKCLIFLRRDNIRPQAMKRTNHAFELQTFDRPVQCLYCSKYLRGLIYQGYKCTVCNICSHKQCIAHSGRCGAPLVQVYYMSALAETGAMNGADAALRDKLWFVGEMERGTAESELNKRENGTFLVRIRPQSDDDTNKYALSLK